MIVVLRRLLYCDEFQLHVSFRARLDILGITCSQNGQIDEYSCYLNYDMQSNQISQARQILRNLRENPMQAGIPCC